jgi:hypothetical protein
MGDWSAVLEQERWNLDSEIGVTRREYQERVARNLEEAEEMGAK